MKYHQNIPFKNYLPPKKASHKEKNINQKYTIFPTKIIKLKIFPTTLFKGREI